MFENTGGNKRMTEAEKEEKLDYKSGKKIRKTEGLERNMQENFFS